LRAGADAKLFDRVITHRNALVFQWDMKNSMMRVMF
jgi:hypothetical protein